MVPASSSLSEVICIHGRRQDVVVPRCRWDAAVDGYLSATSADPLELGFYPDIPDAGCDPAIGAGRAVFLGTASHERQNIIVGVGREVEVIFGVDSHQGQRQVSLGDVGAVAMAAAYSVPGDSL